MSISQLEHANITVSDPARTAQLLCDIFGWHIRWEGTSMSTGRSIHVGTGASYLALYHPNAALEPATSSYRAAGGLNHVGVTVNDLDAVEARVLAAGLRTHSHGDYEPGRRFYFEDHDGVEYEVVSYE